MALSTPKTYRNQVMYSVYIRNYSQEGTFAALEQDLDRIAALGVDVIWLLPIHPIGEKCRKGTLGSPYAIRDYRAVNPEFGTMEDFRSLVDAIHARGMKCIIDVVYNHTSPDSWLAEHHPEWFYHKADGSFGNRIGDWYDVIDLDYSNKDLWDYQIETLKQWAAIVDGFRCDVAPLVPLAFWLKARAEVETVHPGCLWLAESVEPQFIRYCRSVDMNANADSEVYQAFDLCYDYDIFPAWMNYLLGNGSLGRYAEAINAQETTYPDNYVKLRFLENHDQNRAKQLIPNERALRNFTAFLYFQKGMVLLYNGQEAEATHTPSLFEREPINWNNGHDLSPLLRKLAEIKRLPIFTHSSYQVTALQHDFLLATHTAGKKMLVGVFSLRGEHAVLPVTLPDGQYRNLLSGETVDLRAGRLGSSGEPMIFEIDT